MCAEHFKKLPNSFPKWLYHFYTSTSNAWGLLDRFLTSLWKIMKKNILTTLSKFYSPKNTSKTQASFCTLHGTKIRQRNKLSPSLGIGPNKRRKIPERKKQTIEMATLQRMRNYNSFFVTFKLPAGSHATHENSLYCFIDIPHIIKCQVFFTHIREEINLS